MSISKENRPELLAPAGSIESFHAAINAGADAVYLGLEVFNARLRAKNFTTKTLSYLVPYAHSRGVKVYVTLNTQIKQKELEGLIHVLYQLEQIGVDALITADLGLIEVAKANFPSLKLHGSTQMAIHNRAGIRGAEKLGLSRVILARELTCEEIGNIKKGTTLQLEVFVHGALCYSVSGMCLASSYLGGASGNRGMCTQVCRRKFRQKSTEGYFFSPHDFCAIEYLSHLSQLGVSSFKIEGRMKGPEYVDTVVRAYRASIDDAGKIPEMKKILAYDLGRPKTSFFLGGVTFSGLIDQHKPSGTGLLIGEILSSTSDGIMVSGELELFPGDRLRVHPQDGFEGVSVNVIDSKSTDNKLQITTQIPVGKKGDLVYLVSRKGRYEKLTVPQKADITPVNFRASHPGVKRILLSVNCCKKSRPAGNRLWIKIDTTEWLDHLKGVSCQNVILSASVENMNDFLKNRRLLDSWKLRIIPALPAFVPDREMAIWETLISRFTAHGINRFVCRNIGQSTLFSPGTELIADNPIWIINCASQRAVRKMGFKYFTFSLEDEYLNLKECISQTGILCVYSHIPLFISRIRYAVDQNEDLLDHHGNTFFVSKREGLYYLVARKPLCLTHRIEKLASMGIGNFLIDLSFIKPHGGFLQNIMEAYKSGTRISDSSMFNFKAGLR